MGYASYNENISERYLDSIRDVRAEVRKIKEEIARGSELDSRKRLTALQAKCNRLEKVLAVLEEIATHPWISVAHRYFDDHVRLDKLEQDTREFIERRSEQVVKDKEALDRAIEQKNETEIELRTRIILLVDENKKLRKQNKTIKEDVLYRQNPQKLFGDKVKPLKRK